MGRGEVVEPAARGLVGALLVLVPVVFVPGARDPIVGPKAALVVTGGLFLLAVAVASGVRHRRLVYLPPAVAASLGGLAAWSAVAAAASASPATAVAGFPASRHGLVTIVALAGVVAGTAAVTAPADVHGLLRLLWFGAGSVVLGYGALQLHDRLTSWGGRWDPVRWSQPTAPAAIWSTLGNPDVLAGFIAVVLPVGLALLVVERRPAARRAGLVLLGAAVVELGATSGRAAWMGGVAAATAFVVWSHRDLGARGREASSAVPATMATAGVAAAAAAAVAVALVLSATGHAKYPLGKLAAAGPGTTVDLRAQLWRTAVRIAGHHPLTGLGPDGFGPRFFDYRSDAFARRFGVLTIATDPHDVVLTWLVTAGVPGAAAFVGLVAVSARALRRRLRQPASRDERLLRAAVTAGVLGWLVLSLAQRQDVALDLCAAALLGLALAPGRLGPVAASHAVPAASRWGGRWRPGATAP